MDYDFDDLIEDALDVQGPPDELDEDGMLPPEWEEGEETGNPIVQSQATAGAAAAPVAASQASVLPAARVANPPRASQITTPIAQQVLNYM